MKFIRIHHMKEAVVVAFDICSSSDIIEGLILRNDVERFMSFLGSLKNYLAKLQKSIGFEPYKFNGDGWILFFPVASDKDNSWNFSGRYACFSKRNSSRMC